MHTALLVVVTCVSTPENDVAVHMVGALIARSHTYTHTGNLDKCVFDVRLVKGGRGILKQHYITFLTYIDGVGIIFMTH